MKRELAILAAAGAVIIAGRAAAGEAFAGVYAHDVNDRISKGKYETSPQVIFGVRTASLDELAAIGRPHVHLLASVSTTGGTDYLAAGLSWRLKVTRRLYVQPGVGVAIHDRRVAFPSPNEPGVSAAERLQRVRDAQTKLDLGSRVLFEPELSIGYKATPRLSVELSWIHLSHGWLAGGQNPGLSDFGLRLLYRYGIDR